MRVNLNLMDGSKVANCNIYKEDVEKGEMPYTTEEEIENALRKVPWGLKHVCYQNSNLHGKIHVNNIESYEFVPPEIESSS